MGHFRTFGCQLYAKIPDKSRIKSQKTALVKDREGYFIGFTSESIYWVYFPNSGRIETIRDLEFDESYNNEDMGTTIVEEPLFSFLKLEFFTDNIFNTPVRDKELPIPSVSYSAKDNSDPLSTHSLDDNSLLSLQKLTRICHEPIQYGLVAQNSPFSLLLKVRFVSHSVITRLCNLQKLTYGNKL